METVENLWPDPPLGWSGPEWSSVPAAERGLHIPTMTGLLQANRLPWPSGVDTENPVYARLDHGRWLVQCPLCSSAQHVATSDPRFYCVGCGNGGGGRWRPVILPADRAAVETEAAARSGPVMWAHRDDPSVAARHVRQRIDPPRRPGRPPQSGR